MKDYEVSLNEAAELKEQMVVWNEFKEGVDAALKEKDQSIEALNSSLKEHYGSQIQLLCFFLFFTHSTSLIKF